MHVNLHDFTQILSSDGWWCRTQTAASLLRAFQPLVDVFCLLWMLPQPWAKAGPRRKKETHTLLFMTPLPGKRALGQFVQITLQISTADFYYCVSSECGCKIYVLINAPSKEDFHRCPQGTSLPSGIRWASGSFCAEGGMSWTVILHRVSEPLLRLFNTTFRENKWGRGYEICAR